MSKGGTRGEPLVVVSPHPDDAAYSVGGLLSGRAFGWPVLGVTVFTRSQAMTYGEPALSRAIGRLLSLLSSQPRVNRPRQKVRILEVMRLRKREDASYFKAIVVPRVDLNLLDAPLRGYGWSPLVSDKAVVRRDPILEWLVPLFDNLVASLVQAANSSSAQASESGHNPGRCVMLLPLGLGGHVDHLLVREACSSLNKDHVRIYYEDLPYADRLTEDEIERAARDFDPGLKPHLFSIKTSLARKIEDLRLYRTQVGDKEVERVLHYANRFGENLDPCERLWYRPLPEDSSVRKLIEEAEYFPLANPFSKVKR
jgi:LmbE family N-acetylglucosaminyl deacetylase